VRAQGWGQVWVVFLLVGVKACYQTHLLVCVCVCMRLVCVEGDRCSTHSWLPVLPASLVFGVAGTQHRQVGREGGRGV
jgi:hypothetical protein